MEDQERRNGFVLWYLNTFHRRRAPYQCPLPEELVHWLNTPAIILSDSIHSRPVLTGSTPNSYPKYLTRFMMQVWLTQARHFDVFQEKGFYGFLAWYAVKLMPEWNLPLGLLPEPLIQLLNLPAHQTLPLTVCMLVNKRAERALPETPDSFVREEELFALCFAGLNKVLGARDVRLIPPYVSAFWRRSLLPDGSLTVFEFIAAKAFGAVSDEDEPTGKLANQIHQWFAADYLSITPSADIFGSIGVSNLSPQDTDTLSMKPGDKQVIVYRDHKTICGLSKAGLHAVSALRQTGCDVMDLDYALPRDRMDDEYTHNNSFLCNSRQTLHIINLNPEYVPECLFLHLPKVKSDDYMIGQFYWELSDISSIHELAISLVDEIWVASQYLVDVYSRHTDKPVINMGQAVTAKNTPLVSRDYYDLPSSDYLFLVIFDAMSSVERKNPLAAVQAFRQAFPKGTEPAGLVIKTRNISHVTSEYDLRHWSHVVEAAESDSRIRILDRTLSPDELTGLMHTCDCYVSLHRSEGFGYGVAEAMLQSKPVIVTNYSAVCDFCDSDTSALVPYTPVSAEPGMYLYMDDHRDYLWAEPDVTAAAMHMQNLLQNPAQGRALGRRGRAVIETRYSVAALSERYQTRLAELGFLKAKASPAAAASCGTW